MEDLVPDILRPRCPWLVSLALGETFIQQKALWLLKTQQWGEEGSFLTPEDPQQGEEGGT